MLDRGRTVSLVVGVTIVAALAIASIVVATSRVSDQPTGPLVRPDPVTGPFEGLGMWVDIWDQPAWDDPEAAIGDMAAHGVGTLFLQTSNASRTAPFVFPDGVRRFIEAAHDHGMLVVGWYLPHLRSVDTDLARVMAAIDLRTPRGDRFDGFALDIESEVVADPFIRTRRLASLSTRIRAASGDRYPLGAVVPSPIRLRDDLAYWPAFPWHDLAITYDAILPMTYFTWRVHGPAATTDYVSACLDLIQEGVGSHGIAINVIGGLARDATEPETRAFVRATEAGGAIGGGWYTWPYATSQQWAVLERLA